jgi:integral membrane sensor domain MASE1
MWRILLVAAAYFCLGWLVCWANLLSPEGFAIWPSAGVALLALLRYGNGAWPGIFTGSVIFSYWFLSPVDGIATLDLSSHLNVIATALGATVQALIGAQLVHRWVKLPNNFDRDSDIAKFFVIAGPVACVVMRVAPSPPSGPSARLLQPKLWRRGLRGGFAIWLAA